MTTVIKVKERVEKKFSEIRIGRYFRDGLHRERVYLKMREDLVVMFESGHEPEPLPVTNPNWFVTPIEVNVTIEEV